MFGLNKLCLFYATISKTKIMYCLGYFVSFIQKSALFPSLWRLAKFRLKITLSSVTTADNFCWSPRWDTIFPHFFHAPMYPLLPDTENKLSTRRRQRISFRVSKHHILNNIIPKKYQHKNIHAKLPIINLKVDQTRFMLLREQKVIFWWEAFVILVFLSTRATLGKGLFVPLPSPTHVSKHQVHCPYLHTLLKQSSH